VRPNDTLSEIALRELGSSRRWQEIQAVNPGLDPARLRSGQTIALPQPRSGTPIAASATRTDAARSAAQPAAAPRATWKIGAGENLWRIAERALGDGKRWREIAALNPKVDPDRLVVGTVLALPAANVASKSSGRSQPIVASAAPTKTRGETLAKPAKVR
jgi:nucleoid-associated protein YgaU